MSAQPNYRLINIDRLDPDSPNNFDLSTLVPSGGGDDGRRPSTTIADAQTLADQIRQLLRGGDPEGALRGALEKVPYGGDDRTKARTPPLFPSSASTTKRLSTSPNGPPGSGRNRCGKDIWPRNTLARPWIAIAGERSLRPRWDERSGTSSRDGHGDPPVHQTVRHVPTSQWHLSFGRRSRSVGRLDEVSVRHPVTDLESSRILRRS